MSLQNQFSKFHDKIKLGREDDTYRDARSKDSSILDDLRDEFKNAGYPIIETFIQGSLSTHTGIKHPVADFDIDRAVVIDADNAPDDPVEVKKLVLKVLEKRGLDKFALINYLPAEPFVAWIEKLMMRGRKKRRMQKAK